MHFKKLWPLAWALLGLPVFAQDLSVSGFGTLGYARSNHDATYQRSIDRSGTFDRDSVLGLQGDLRLNPQWSATVQLKAAPSLRSDDRWDLRPALAFAAWRASDDWLLRAGRMRVPLYLHSESMDVGVTHDMARLPAEMYLLAPNTDFNGLFATRSWPRGQGELALDLYTGRIATSARIWSRDGVPPLVPPGAQVIDISVRSSGAVLTLRQPDSTWRGGVHRTNTRRRSGERIAVDYPFVPIAPGLGYYQVDDAMPGPGVPTVPSISNTVITVGFEQQFATDWRLSAEFARNIQQDTEVGADSRGGYLALSRRFGSVAPYASVGMLRSSAGILARYRNLTGNPLPAMVPGADQINAAQRLAAESFYSYDQRSLAIGAAWTIDPTKKLKFEWQRTRVGQVSFFFDTPPGQAVPHDTHVDVWSVNYNFSF